MGKPKMPVLGRRPQKQQVIEFSKSKMPDLQPTPSDDQRRSFKDVKRASILAGLRAMKAPTVTCQHFLVYGLGTQTGNRHNYSRIGKNNQSWVSFSRQRIFQNMTHTDVSIINSLQAGSGNYLVTYREHTYVGPCWALGRHVGAILGLC